jgi:hypothetical protein
MHRKMSVEEAYYVLKEDLESGSPVLWLEGGGFGGEFIYKDVLLLANGQLGFEAEGKIIQYTPLGAREIDILRVSAGIIYYRKRGRRMKIEVIGLPSLIPVELYIGKDEIRKVEKRIGWRKD